MVPPRAMTSANLANFRAATLFYMFYVFTCDFKQIIAAKELYRRGWRYHGKLQLWLMPRSLQEQQESRPDAPYYYFDADAWKPWPFTNLLKDFIEDGLLSYEEVSSCRGSINASGDMSDEDESLIGSGTIIQSDEDIMRTLRHHIMLRELEIDEIVFTK